MAANTDLLKKVSRRWVGQIGSGGVADAVAVTIPFSSTTNLPTDTAVVATIDRVDANGTATPGSEETVVGVVSGSNLTSVTRGVEGTAQAHAAGAVVEILITAAGWNDIVSWGLVEHSQLGIHDATILAKLAGAQTFTGIKTFTTGLAKIADIIDTVNALKVLVFAGVASAVNYLTVTNSATGNPVQLTATGTDSNIELKLASKGSKQINLSTGHYQGLQAYSPTGGGTATLDLSLGNDHRITMPAGNATIALSNEQTGQKFLVSITQDSVGSRTVTWFTTIKWAGGVAPTLTTTANKRDTFGFVVTGSGTYDGFVVGQAL